MAKSLIALWLTLIAAIATISVLAQFWIHQREQSATNRVREILRTQLEPLNATISRVIENYALDLRREIGNCDLANPQACREITRLPLSQAMIVVNRESQLTFPEQVSRESTDRRTLIDEAQQLLREQSDPRPASRLGTASNANTASSSEQEEQIDASDNVTEDNATNGENSSQRSALRSRSYYGASNTSQQSQLNSIEDLELTASPSSNLVDDTASSELPPQKSESAGQFTNAIPPAQNFGWITWYHRRGLVLGFWWHQSRDWKSIVILPRARWMADIVAALPDTRDPIPRAKLTGSDAKLFSLSGSLKQLVDVEGSVIYQWGDAPASEWKTLVAQGPSAELPVANPLEGWRLRIFATESLQRQLAGDDMIAPIWIAVAGIATALLLCGCLVTFSLDRQLRLASSRVSFVNQVSHELRTPLTNICMYADLLADDIEADGASSAQMNRVEVIQNESRRLNRLISNVLEFARTDTQAQPLRLRAIVLDDLVDEVLSTFRPRLEELNFQVERDLNTPEPRELDQDAVEQILVNLIGNAEKYAATGKLLQISTKANEDEVEIVVRDAGQGVPRRMAERIFAPFVRLSDRLEDPAGTGIGLTIVRELARKHGGDCRLLSTSSGAAFCCTIIAPRVNS